MQVVQLYETWLVRHGIMITGASGGGKSQIFNTLATALSVVKGQPFKIVRCNPKSFTSQEMFGETDAMTGEWTTGVFAALWEKYNNRNLPYNTWLICDGPVDAVWIESMNTVLDDNKVCVVVLDCAAHVHAFQLRAENVHALEGLACRKRVAHLPPLQTQGAALASPTLHACGCTRPLACFGHKIVKADHM